MQYFTPTGEFGYYLERAGSTAYTGTDAAVHFALFSNVHAGSALSEYFIAAEDIFEGKSDLDYNDLVVHVIVPEPGFLGILAMAAGGLFVAYRRRRTSAA